MTKPDHDGITNGARSRIPRSLVLGVVTVIGASLIALAGVELFLLVTDFHYELRVHIIESTAPESDQFQRAFIIDTYLIWVDRGYYRRLSQGQNRKIDIAFMGDSCTQFGKYPEFLSLLIHDESNREVGVIKLGVAGWTTHQGLNQVMRDVAPLEPEVITVFFGWNDHWLSIGLNDKQVEHINGSMLGRVQRLRLGQLITKAYVAFAREKEDPVVRVREEDFYENLTGIVEQARSMGAVPVLITAPSAHQKGNEPSYLAGRWISDLSKLVPTHQRYVDIVRKVAQERSVALCDAAREFQSLPKTDGQNGYFRADGIHLTEEGDKRLAEMLFDCLENNGLLEMSTDL